jgi:hypothetical protein
MSEPLIQEDPNSPGALAQRFRDMADRMVLNGDKAFGGSFVIVPPKDGGAPIETLILDAKQDPAQFWAIVETKAKMALAGLDELSRNQQAVTRR